MALLYSLVLHISLFLLLFIQIPSWTRIDEVTPSAPIMIDLKNVQIADKTNVPPKLEKKKQAAAQPVAKPKAKPKIKEEVKPKETKQKTAAAPVQDKKKAQKPTKKRPVTKAKAAEPKKSLESLLASVEKMAKTTPNKGTDKGVQGATSGDISQPLTMSELDFVAAAVRQNWYLDAGAQGIDTMIINIKIELDKSGKVLSAQILDKTKYRQDVAFRSVAESARRAVLICDGQGAESPFRTLAKKRPDTYREWREMTLRFSPLDGITM